MVVQSWDEMEWEKVTAGLSRKIIAGERAMVAQIKLNKGAVVPEHSHESEQVSYVLTGALKFWIGEEEMVVRSGQVVVIPSKVPHRALALEETFDIDIFSPIRKNWLDHTDTYFHEADN